MSLLHHIRGYAAHAPQIQTSEGRESLEAIIVPFEAPRLVPPPSMPSVASIRRPFGGPPLVQVPCRLVPAHWGGRSRWNGGLWVSHYADFGSGENVRDGQGRTTGLNFPVYGDGDEVRITVGGRTSSFVVVWVEDRFCDTDSEHRRAYLLRHLLETTFP